MMSKNDEFYLKNFKQFSRNLVSFSLVVVHTVDSCN